MDQIQADKVRAEEEKKLEKMEMKDQMAELRRRAEAAEDDFEERIHTINEEARYHGTLFFSPRMLQMSIIENLFLFHF